MKSATRARLLTLLAGPVLALVGGCTSENRTTAPRLVLHADLAAGAAQSATLPDGVVPVAPEYVTGAGAAALSADPIFRTYKNFNAWFGENRDNATLLSIGKVLGSDYFVHPLSDLAAGIPPGTAVVYMSSNGLGDLTATAQQNDPAAQANLAAFLAGGGVVIVDMGDNDFFGGYRIAGATGTPDYVFPDPCFDATLAAAARGPDGILGTADDHPMVKGPDGVAGTSDDLDDSNIDVEFSCLVAHGNLTDGITLPPDATVLATAMFNGVAKPILAEYCYMGSGRVILDTQTKEFIGQKPFGTGPSFFLRNLFTYAQSPEAQCTIRVEFDIKPGSSDNPVNLKSKGVIPTAVLSTQVASGEAVDFDATTIDVSTVRFGPGGAMEAHGHGHLEDVDGDGDTDMVLHFDTQASGIGCGDTQATISGRTTTGRRFEGKDAVRPTGC